MSWDSKRNLNQREKREKLEEQGGRCPVCGKRLGMSGAECHHEVPHGAGGPSTKFNSSMVHSDCHDKLTKQGGNDISGNLAAARAKKFVGKFYPED